MILDIHRPSGNIVRTSQRESIDMSLFLNSMTSMTLIVFFNLQRGVHGAWDC